MTFAPAPFFLDLGLRPRPLFAPPSLSVDASGATQNNENLILLDGVTASFALSLTTQRIDDDSAYYDWSWSSNVTHHVEVDEYREGTGVVLVRRWDAPNAIRRFTLRSVVRHGADFIAALEKAGPARGSSSIQRALVLLRQVRELVARASQPDACVRVFHVLLKGTAKVRAADDETRIRWRDAVTLGDALDAASLSHIEGLDRIKLYGVQSSFAEPDRASGRVLDPRLLLRHAAGFLYEEVHRELARAETQIVFDFATPSGNEPTRKASSVIHFTPPGLARVMAERAWHYLSAVRLDSVPVVVLDPACGSGSFLLEAYLSSDRRRKSSSLTLRGFDVSSRAVEMTSLALEDAVEDASARSNTEVRVVDALSADWGQADIVLMNPPFIAWNALSLSEKDSVRKIIGSEQGRPDIALAFLKRALDCLSDGGVLAAVLPSSLLSASSAESIRDAISAIADVHVIGRFRGNDIFANALVEPAVVIVQKRIPQSERSVVTTMLLSSPGSSEAALRALRRGTLIPEDTGRYEIYDVPSPIRHKATDGSSDGQTPGIASWLPRPQLLLDLLRAFRDRAVPRVADVFDVKQGIRSGDNAAFVLSDSRLELVTSDSHRMYFRKLAGNKTIEDGSLSTGEWIFYPYDKRGLILKTEAELRRAVPDYYRKVLLPSKDSLSKRKGIDTTWWTPTWPRNWQYTRQPKIISSYFGRAGKFAFDATGEFVVGQGFGWLLKDIALSRVLKFGNKSVTLGEVTREFGPAYVALFNSRRFCQLLSYFTYRVMGGQLDLSPRYVNDVPVPDLISPDGNRADVVLRLREIGARMGRGAWPDNLNSLDDLVAEAYGVPPNLWPDDT